MFSEHQTVWETILATSPIPSKAESSQMSKVGLISVALSMTSHCLLLSPLVCHSNFLEGNTGKNVHTTRRSVASLMYDFFRKLRGVQLFSQNTKGSGITKGLWRTSGWQKQQELSATSLKSSLYPPKPAAACLNYPTGIENSTGSCLSVRQLKKYFIQNQSVDIKLLLVQAVQRRPKSVLSSIM